jgi:hypothetical protein
MCRRNPARHAPAAGLRRSIARSAAARADERLLGTAGTHRAKDVHVRRRKAPQGGTEPIEERTMLWTIIAILLVLWLLGLIGQVGGGLIWLLLVIAAIVLVFQLLSGRRAV